MRLLLRSITALAFFAIPGAAYACSCMMGAPICQTFWESPVVFSGRVTEIAPPPDNSVMWRQKSVKFTVSAEYRGKVGQAVSVSTGMGGGDCGYNFVVGEDYLVYGYMDPESGKLSTGICSRTRKLSDAAEDLQFINALSSAGPSGSIFGKVYEYKPRRSEAEWQAPPPVPDLRVSMSGPDAAREAVTDAAGAYRFDGLAPGEYTLKFLAPEGFTASQKEQKVSVVAKGCAMRDLSLTRQTSVSGRILDPDGTPVTKLLVDLIPTDMINERHQRDRFFGQLDEDGRFTIDALPPGSYYLGIGLGRWSTVKHAFPRTFYPGTQLPERAAVIIIAEGDVIKNLDFQLPPKMKERKIEGIVVFPDGKPAAKASLNLQEGEFRNEAGGGETSADGRFTLTVYEGLNYRLKSVVNLETGQRHAEWIDIPAKGNVKGIKLVITEPNGSCSRCLR